jgi:hypothetical protein
MNTLQDLLIILDGQQLSAGYLTPAGNGTAHDTVRALKQGFDPFTLAGNPLPGMTNQPGAPNLLFAPAWVGSLGAGQDAIFLADVGGRLDLSKAGPAYKFSASGGAPPPVLQNYSLFAGYVPSTSGNGAAINVGIVFTVTKPGNVTAVRFYRYTNSTITSGFIGAIWDTASKTLLGQVNYAGVSGFGWQQQALSTPIPVVTGTQYTVSVYVPDGNFGYTSSNPPITTGVLQAPTGLGLYNQNAGLAYPVNNQSGINYSVDLVFQA